MARVKKWDVYLDNQTWFSLCVIAKYHREAVRLAHWYRDLIPSNRSKAITLVKRSPRIMK
jgi:hypothetical protein